PGHRDRRRRSWHCRGDSARLLRRYHLDWGTAGRRAQSRPAYRGRNVDLRRIRSHAANTRDEDVAYAIACVTVFGSVAMFAHPIPADAKAWIVAVTTFLQAIALAAMRPETNIGRLTAKGFRPALLGGLAFLFIAGFCLTLIKLMDQHSMTLEQLRMFIAVAEKQHVTQAASQLNLTQSATSAAIAALEARYGIKLFDRVGRGIVLTQTGRDFLNEAREVVARAKAAAQVLDDLAGLKRGSLTLAA